MNRYSRMHLSPEVVMRNLDTIDLEEQSRIAEGIALIAVLDERRDYLAAGYSCMRNYCMDRLRMSEDKALRRIQVARVALRFPEVFEHLADGRLSVTTAAVLAPHLMPDTAAELLDASAFRTKHEIVRMLAERSRPVAALAITPERGSLVQITSGEHAPAHVTSLSDLCAPPPELTPGEHALAHVGMTRRGRVTPSPCGNYDVRLSITADEHSQLRQVQALLGHAVPSGDPAEIYARAMKHYLALLEKQRFGVKPGAAAPAANARSIPKSLRRLIWERDGARCTFMSADGHRCEETGRLEIDHITPVAMGGSSTPANLRLLCSSHNAYEAERVLGKVHAQRQRELAQHSRARTRVATEANVARAKARDAVQQDRHDDLHAALRGLGFNGAQAKHGAEMADATPNASLETCLRLALAELTRAVVIRGERRARCTA